MEGAANALDAQYIVNIAEELSGEELDDEVQREQERSKDRFDTHSEMLKLLRPRILVMESGDRDLAVVALKEQLTLSTTQLVFSQIACSLEHLHSVRILHGDVSAFMSRFLFISRRF